MSFPLESPFSLRHGEEEDERHRENQRRRRQLFMVAGPERDGGYFGNRRVVRVAGPRGGVAAPLFRRRKPSEVRGLRGAEALDGDNHQPSDSRMVQKWHEQ